MEISLCANMLANDPLGEPVKRFIIGLVLVLLASVSASADVAKTREILERQVQIRALSLYLEAQATDLKNLRREGLVLEVEEARDSLKRSSLVSGKVAGATISGSVAGFLLLKAYNQLGLGAPIKGLSAKLSLGTLSLGAGSVGYSLSSKEANLDGKTKQQRFETRSQKLVKELVDLYSGVLELELSQERLLEKMILEHLAAGSSYLDVESCLKGLWSKVSDHKIKAKISILISSHQYFYSGSISDKYFFEDNKESLNALEDLLEKYLDLAQDNPLLVEKFNEFQEAQQMLQEMM